METGLKEFVHHQFHRTVETLRETAADSHLHETLIAAAQATATALRNSGKLLAAGNGGSAADAQHLAAEFVVRLTVDRPPMRAIALTTDTSILTAAGNDYGYDRVFARQVEALGLPGDIFLGISTSGKSRNILQALIKAKETGLTTIGLCGLHTETMHPWCDYLIAVPSSITQNIQESHLTIEHIFCGLVEHLYLGVNFPKTQLTEAAEVR